MTRDPDYPTCAATFLTLCIHHAERDPEVVSRRLQLTASHTQRRGDPRPSTTFPHPFRIGGWFLTSEGELTSRDVRDHLDWLVARLAGRADALARLRAEGWTTTVSVYWRSRTGHGGPTINADGMAACGELGLDLWFDVYASPQADDDAG